LHRNGVNLSGLIATSAVVTVVLGLGLQATLGNVIGGIALQIDDSIHAGDWIRLPQGIEGLVKEVRWRHTVVETRNWDTLILPNSQLLAEHIVILGKRHDQPVQHRMWVYFNVDFRYSPVEVIRVINDALLAAPIPNVAAEPRPHCICFDFAKEGGESVAYYAVRYWLTDLAKDDPTSSDVRVRIYAALKRADIPLALPAHALFVSYDDPQHDERKHLKELHQRREALERVEVFGPLSDQEKNVLCASMKRAPFATHEIITAQGASAHWLYLLVKGEVEVRVRGESGEERAVNRIKAPNVFGEMGVMTGEPRTASVVALTEVECFRIDKEAFRQVVQGRPDIAETVAGVIAKRRVELQAVREGLDNESRKKRVVDERNKIFASLQSFFGLDDDSRSRR
jgi:CRP-like cAMP-binding protein